MIVTNDPRMRFDEGTHAYFWQGVKVPSVSQVIKKAGLSHGFYTPGASERGTAIHAALEAADRGEPVPEEFHGYASVWQEFKLSEHIEVLEIEASVYSEKLMVAGRLDRIVTWDGELILDFKTGRPEKWHALQLAGYSALVGPERKLGGVDLYIDARFRIKARRYDFDELRPLIMEFKGLCDATCGKGPSGEEEGLW